MYDLRYDMYERSVTFEGEEYHSRTIAMRGKELKSHLRYLAGGIAKHIREVT